MNKLLPLDKILLLNHYLSMNSNMLGLLVSISLILLILFFVFVLKKITHMNDELLRKIVHISVSNWWLLNLLYVSDVKYAIVGPIAFMFMNSIFVFKPKVGDKFGFVGKQRNYGLVYYPFSLGILVLLCYNNIIPYYAGTIGVLCMGYGDGFAAITGSIWGKSKIPFNTGGKTYLGSFVMVVVCNLVCVFTFALATDFSTISIIIASLIISIVASLVEMITPLGLDNISVPIITAVLAGAIL
jgi:phytol kinase